MYMYNINNFTFIITEFLVYMYIRTYMYIIYVYVLLTVFHQEASRSAWVSKGIPLPSLLLTFSM